MNLYQQRVLNARKEFLRLNKNQERELLKIYQDLSKQLSSEIASCRTSSSKQYLNRIKNMVKIYINELNTKLSKTIRGNIKASSDIANETNLAYYELITNDIKLRTMFNKSIINTSANTVKKLIQGKYYTDGKTLDHRIWNITKKNGKDIDTFIKVNIARGANARKLAKQVDKYANPLKRIEAKTLEAGMNKSISYQAQRLARTSITHSFEETTIENAKSNPFNIGIKWNLSASHYERQVKRWGEDICDECAGKIFKPNEVPLQHPNCLCYLTEENEDIDKAIDELKTWTNGENNAKLDKWLEDYGEEFGIERNKSKAFSKLAASKKKNSSIIKSDTKSNSSNSYQSIKSNVQWNKYLNISNDNCKKLNDIHTSLNEFMHINNREKLVLLDIENNSIVHELEGEKDNQVTLTKETKKVLKKSSSNSIVFVHNHPSKTTFSRYDIYQMIKYKSVNSMTLECVEGSKFVLERGKMKSSILNDFNFAAKYDKIYWKVAEKYPELDDKVKINKVWSKFLDDVTKEVAKLYGMNYKKVIE